MRRLSPSARISLGLVSLTLSLLFVLSSLGFIPHRRLDVLDKRRALSEAMAIQFSYCAQKGDISTFKAATQAIVARNPDIVSAAVRRVHDGLLFEVGDHQGNWTNDGETQSSPTHFRVPITVDDQPWGAVELCFRPLAGAGWGGPLSDPIIPIVCFVAVAGFLAYFVYLRLVLRGCSGSSAAIPSRVRTALDTLAEGVVIMDKSERIAIANYAFGDLVGRPAPELEGCKLSEFTWAFDSGNKQDVRFPWQRAADEGTTELGAVMTLTLPAGPPHRVSVNAAPIVTDDGAPRGVMATFDNLAVVEKKNAQLRKLLRKLKHSRAIIQKQNLTLRAMATRDPLTDCLNRRAFFDTFETHWAAAARFDTPLCCLMVDIDHFKSINDRYGHATGDLVLQHVARTLSAALRKTDTVCRYGGEEFCILLPQVELEGALQAGQRFREAIEADHCSGIKVTASIGVAAVSMGAAGPRELLNQADLALYAAKRAGRNQVMAWGPQLQQHDKRAPELCNAN